MRKFYSFLLLTLLTALGFHAQADVTVKFTNPDGVFALKLGGPYGEEVNMTGDSYSWDNSQNLAVIFNEDVAMESISADGKNLTEGSEYDKGTFYNYVPSYSELPMITMYYGYVADGSTILINNGTGSGSGGGDTDPKVKTWTYSIYDDSYPPADIRNIISVTSSDLEVTYNSDPNYYEYTVKATENDLSSTFTIAPEEGYKITELMTNNGDNLQPNADGSFTIKVSDYQDDYTFWLKFAKKTVDPVIYIVKSDYDILTFSAMGSLLSVPYDEQAKAYTFDAANYLNGSIDLNIAEQYRDVYSFVSVTYPGGNVYINPNYPYGVSLPAYSLKSDTEFVVTYDVKGSQGGGDTGDVVKFQFSDPSAVYGVFKMSPNGESVSLEGDYVNWDVNSTDNVYVVFNEGVTVSSVVNSTTGTTIAQNGMTWETGTYSLDETIYPILNIMFQSALMRNYFEAGQTVTINTNTSGSGETPANTIKIVVTDSEYVTAKAGSTTLTFTNNAVDYDLSDGTPVTFTGKNNATIAAITAVNSNDETVQVPLSGSLPASTITAYLSGLKAGSTVTVTLTIPTAQGMVYNFTGPEGIKVVYNGEQAPYDGVKYTVSNLNPTQLWSAVQITVEDSYKDKLELVNVTMNGNVVGELYQGMIEIQSYEFPSSTDFVINTQEVGAGGGNQGETINTTFTVVNGFGYLMDMWNATTGAQIEIYTNNPTPVEFTQGDNLFIGMANGELYQLVVDGVVVDQSLCDVQESFYDKYGYMLTPDCGYYPTNGGSVQMYQEKPATSDVTISFNFVNEGTQGFVKQLKVKNQYVFLEKEEVDKILSEGKVTIEEGSYFEAVFDTDNYSVTTLTVNDENIEGSSYTNSSVTSDLTFNINVTKDAGNKVTVVSEGWANVLVSDPDNNTYTLTGETTVLDVPKSIEMLRFTAKEGYVIPDEGVVVGGTKYNQGDGITVVDGMTVNVTCLLDGDEPTPDPEIVFTFNCEADVLTFTQNGVAVEAPYAQGAYTLSNFEVGPSLMIALKDDTYNLVGITAVTPNAPTVRVEGNQGMVTTYGVTASATFDVEIEQAPADTEITIVVTDQSYVSASFEATYLTFEDNKATWDLTKGTSLKFTAANGATIASIDVKDASGENVQISMSANLPASEVTAYLTNVPGGSTINVTLNIPEPLVYRFTGVEGLKVVYDNVQAPYENGVYTVSNLNSASLYSQVEISVEESYAEQIELVNVTVDGEEIATPTAGVIYIGAWNYPTATDFVINTQEVGSTGDNITFTAQLMTGAGYQAELYVGNNSYDFYTNPQTIKANPTSDVIFITSGYGVDQLYQVTVGGTVIPASLWEGNETYGDREGFTIEPGSEYYPKNGDKIEIFVTEPASSTYNVSLQFTNDGTQGFLNQVTVGYTNLTMDEWIDGVQLEKGQRFALTFNTSDYTVNSITLNGQDVTADFPEGYVNEGIESDLNFVFDVTMSGGNTITVNAENWEHLIVTNSDQEPVELTGATTTLTFPSTINFIRFAPAEGWEIPLGGITVQNGSPDQEPSTAGDNIFVVNGMTVNVTVNQKADPSTRTFYFASSADVIEFTGTTASPGAPGSEEVDLNVSYADGKYTVSNISAYLTLTVKEENRAEYIISKLISSQGALMSYDKGVSVSFPTSRFTDGEEFTVMFENNDPPRIVSINVSNPSYIQRIYNDNVTITSFPYEYNLNDGLTLNIEAANNCQIDGITIADASVQGTFPATTFTLDLTDAEELDVIMINASVIPGDITYTFSGVEGLQITYNRIQASYENGIYTLDNILESQIGNYPVEISVASGYENKVTLVNATDGTNTWEPAGASGVIIIPASQLPKVDTNFTVTTRTPSASETTRTVYLTIDDPSVVSYGLYQGQSGYFGFGEDGSVALTIKPTEYVVQVVTTKPITSIETDVEGNVKLPTLPATDITLDLSNATEGQTISLFTEDITLRKADVTVDNDKATATVTVNFSISNCLVGKVLDVYVGETLNSTFVPQETTGTFEVEISDLKEGENKFTITLKSERAEDSIDVEATLSGVSAIFMDENGNEVDVYNMHGVKMKPGRLQPGFYIVNGQKVLLK